MKTTNPAIVVHDVDQCVAAIQAVAQYRSGVLILSPRGAAASIGAPAMLELYRIACGRCGADGDQRSAVDGITVDCGPDAGYAMSALRAGAASIVFDPDTPAYERICGLASAYGASVATPSVYETAIDLFGVGDAEEACHSYLQQFV